MATRSLTTRKPTEQSSKYRLPEAVRRQILKGSTSRPDAVIPVTKLEIVEQQRLRFIERFGSDGF